MSDWVPIPEPVSWKLPDGTTLAGMRYNEVALRAPTGEDVLKATALKSASAMDLTIRLIEAVSGVPYDVVKKLPEYQLQQMSAYMDAFAEAPAPDPLEAWRKARRDAATASAGDQAGASAAT